MKKLLFLIITLQCIQVNAQTHFNLEQEYPDGYGGQYTCDLATLDSYSAQHISDAFDFITSSEIYFDYPQGGCQNRAEIMHIILQNNLQLAHAKIWFFAPIDLYPNDERHLKIVDPNGNALNDTIKWKYHVAPVLIRKNTNGELDTLVIDPSINSESALLLKDWLGSMKNADVSKYTFLKSEFYSFYTRPNSNVINGFFYPYEPHWVEDFHRSTMERGLAANDLAEYMMNELKAGYPDAHGNVKLFLANQDNIYNFFLNPYDKFDGRAELLQNNPVFMRKAECHYWERLAYWKRKTNELMNLE